jgi:thiamine biosynthesis protein ThiI
LNDIILLKLGELVLKGLNRRSFEQRLIANINRRIEGLGKFRIYSAQSIIYVEPLDSSCDMDETFEALKQVFGIISLSRAAVCEKSTEAILQTAKTYLADELNAAYSFKVETKRSDKSFPMTSIELSQYIGGALHEAFPHLAADMHEPEITVQVEVRDSSAYVHAGGVRGAGGLPVGSGGRAVTLLSGGIDSPVASYMMAKRGLRLIPIHFFSFPYTSELAKQKVIDLASVLTNYCGKLTVEIVPFTRIQEEIRAKCPEQYFTIIMRRFMMRISQIIADMNGCKAIITGENLGQVASQTMEAMAATEACCSLPVLRPLIGMDKEEIITLARKIGTYDLSILPYEDCCTVFTPRRPRTKPRLDEVEAVESALDVEALTKEAVAGITRVKA